MQFEESNSQWRPLMLKEAIRWQWEHRYLWCLIPTPYRDGAFMNIVKRFCGGGGGGDREKTKQPKKIPMAYDIQW